MHQPTAAKPKGAGHGRAQAWDSRHPLSLRISGGNSAPGRARAEVESRLASQLTRRQASDTALIVSELVTNSVVHAGVRLDQMMLVELGKGPGRLLISVTDAGSKLEPRLRPSDAGGGHLGLFLIRELSSAWGVERDEGGTTRVWCELPLDPCPAGWPTAQPGSPVH